MIFNALVCFGAEPTAQGIVEQVHAKIKSLGAYESEFKARVKGITMGGHYAVSGDDYYLEIAKAEIYGDAKYRREINHKHKEVIVDRVKAGEKNILKNPAQAFDIADKGFDAKVEKSTSKGWSIVLRPTDERLKSIDKIEMEVERATMLPTSLTYEIGGDKITIKFDSFTPLRGEIPRYDQSKYSGYEVIDF